MNTSYIRLGLRMIPILVILLVVVELLVTNELAGFGKRLAETDRAIEVVKEENQLMSENIASLSSLLTISEKAREFGFTSTPVVVSMGAEDVAFHLQP